MYNILYDDTQDSINFDNLNNILVKENNNLLTPLPNFILEAEQIDYDISGLFKDIKIEDMVRENKKVVSE